jgi:hypothetical protein
MELLLLVIVVAVVLELSNRRTRAINLAGLTAEERAAYLAEEEAKRRPRRGWISWHELITAAMGLGVLLVAFWVYSRLVR